MPEDLVKAIKKERICYLQSTAKKEVIHELVELVKACGIPLDYDGLEKNILDRESLMSTGIGLGVGIPHVRIPEVKGPFITIGISKETISDYESLDGQGVRLVILIVAGTNQHKEYLKLLAVIAKKIKNPAVQDKIFNAGSIDEVYSIFVESESSGR